MNRRASRGIIIGLSIVIGFFLTGLLYDLTLPILVKYNFKVGMTAIGGQFTHGLLLAAGVGLIPIFYFVLNQEHRVNFKLILLLTSGGIIGILVRLFYLIRINDSLYPNFPRLISFGKLNLELYFLLGVTLVGLIGYLILKKTGNATNNN